MGLVERDRELAAVTAMVESGGVLLARSHWSLPHANEQQEPGMRSCALVAQNWSRDSLSAW
jgi:hypothetical protein